MAIRRPPFAGAARGRGDGGRRAPSRRSNPSYRMTRPAADDDSRRARSNRATYELHDRAGAFTSVLFTQQRFPQASELLLGGSIFPAMQNFLLAARALGLGACLTSWASYGGEPLLREAVGVPDDWMLAGHVVVGWPRGNHGPVRRRPLSDVVFLDHWDARQSPSWATTANPRPPTEADRGATPDHSSARRNPSRPPTNPPLAGPARRAGCPA